MGASLSADVVESEALYARFDAKSPIRVRVSVRVRTRVSVPGCASRSQAVPLGSQCWSQHTKCKGACHPSVLGFGRVRVAVKVRVSVRLRARVRGRPLGLVGVVFPRGP